MTTPTEPEALIEAINSQTLALLSNHWTEIQNCRDDQDDIKVSLIHKLTYEGTRRTVKTSISFSGHRVKDEIEQVFDFAQTELPMEAQGGRK